MAFVVASCDNPPSGSDHESKSSFIEQFFAYSDSSNSLLTIAVDTLRKRNAKNNFINSFVKERGFPAWDNASAFYQDGLPIMLVPVTQPAKKEVSGIVFLTMNDTQPVYRWIARGAELRGLAKEDLEVMMLGFEKSIFGKVQKPNTTVRTKRKRIANVNNKSNLLSTDSISWTQCSSTCMSYNGETACGDWVCVTKNYWIRAIDSGSGSGGNGGFGGGPDGGGEIPDGGSTGGGSNYFFGKIDVTALKNFPKLDCIYGKLNQTGTFKTVIADFAGENTNFDLDIKVEPLEDSKNGNPRPATTRANFNNSSPITIVINERYIDRLPNLLLTTVFLHEAIHAEMLRKVNSIGGYDNLNDSNFPGLYDYWIRHGKNSQHEQMAAHYLETLTNGIAEYDNYQQDNLNFYKNLALIGLKGTVTWDGLSGNAQDAVDSDVNKLIENGNYQCN